MSDSFLSSIFQFSWPDRVLRWASHLLFTTNNCMFSGVIYEYQELHPKVWLLDSVIQDRNQWFSLKTIPFTPHLIMSIHCVFCVLISSFLHPLLFLCLSSHLHFFPKETIKTPTPVMHKHTLTHQLVYQMQDTHTYMYHLPWALAPYFDPKKQKLKEC